MLPYNYLLVIKRDRNNYLSIEWNLTKFYNNENLFLLPDIDNFTRKLSKPDLLSELLKKNLVDPNEKYVDFAIIYKNNGKTCELKEGPIFKEDNFILSEDNLIELILRNSSDKPLINDIYNLCNLKQTEKKLEEFKFILKNIDIFKNKGLKQTKIALDSFKNISYENKRKIIFKISTKIFPKLNS